MLADQLDYVVGVDPHRDSHALAVVQVVSGAVVFEAMVVASRDGYAHALQLADQHAPGRRAFAVEGTGSFGAGLTRFLTGRGECVLEVGRLRRERRSGGKTDALDAVRAARGVLTSERPATPRAGGERQALQALVAAREGAVNARRAGLCQLRDLLITTPERCAASCGRSAVRGYCNTSQRRDPPAAETPSCAAACSRFARSLDVYCN
jgi:transposase